MKKLLVLLLSIGMLLALSACGTSKKEVSGPIDFESIDIHFEPITIDSGISDIKYYIVDKSIAEVDFVNSGHNYTFRASKKCGVADILGIDSEPINKYSSVLDGISYSLAKYPEGVSAIWIYDMTTCSLFAEGINEDGTYEFYRMLEMITGEDILEQPVELPSIDSLTTADFIKEWFAENGFKDVDYVYENSDKVDEDYVISLSKQGKAYPSDEIVCTISTGPKKPDIVTVPDDLLGISEDKFIKTLKDLGLGATKGSTKYYSTTIKEGNIFDYDDGSFPVGTVIKYHVSRGRYEFDADDYDGLSKDKAEEFVDDLNKLNAHVTLNLEKHETDNHPAGKIYKCSGEKDGIKMIVSCRLAVEPTDKKVDLPNYVGTYNNPCGMNDYCTVNSINYMIEYHNDGYPSGYVSAQTVPAGKVDPGTNVKLIISGANGYIGRVDSGYYSKSEGNNYFETVESLNSKSFFGDFLNVDYESTYNDAMPDGAVLQVAIYDEGSYKWTATYAEGYYPITTKVRVTVNDLRVFVR